MRNNFAAPMRRGGTLLLVFIPGIVILLGAILLASCQKDNLKKNNPAVEGTGLFDGLDTGLTMTGAAKVDKMFTDTIVNISFKSSEPINLSGAHDIVVSGIATSRITLFNCRNIIIRNCKIGPNAKSGISLNSCTNVRIDSCFIYNVSTAVYAGDSETISVTGCQARNMMGPFPEGQFVQFKNVKGGGNRINFNKFENIMGESYTEDAISTYACNGLPADPIMIESNWIRGGGPSKSGGGIMLGDGTGSYIVAKNNILVDAGQYGMAVSGGDHMSIVNNTVYAQAQSFTNVGLYYRNYSGPPSTNIYIGKNAVSYTNSHNQVVNTILGPGDPAPIGWSTNIFDANLSGNILPQIILSGRVFLSK